MPGEELRLRSLVSVAWTRWRLGSVKPAEESTFSWTGEGLRGDGMAKIDTPCKSDSITKGRGGLGFVSGKMGFN